MDVEKYVLGVVLSIAILLVRPSAEIASIDEIWMLTNEYGGGGFEGEIMIPITNSINSWNVKIEFDRAVRSFQVYEAELVEESENQTTYVVENLIWNGFLQSGDEIYFRIQGFTNDKIPELTITFQNTAYKSLPPREKPKPISNRELRRIISAAVDYKEAIRLSMKFFEAQKSGFTPENGQISWKASSGLYDGTSQGVNLVGGYYIGGDYIKFNFPMAFAMTQLVWGALEFSEGYEDAGQMENLFKTVKWATDYFMKCHTSQTEYYGMVGDPNIELELWESSQSMDWKRPAYKITPDHPGSDLAGETAAALAAASILFQTTAPKYSENLIKHAKEIWQLGERNRGRYDYTAIPKASAYYGSSDFNDELIWGAIWLYKATKDPVYLKFVDSMYGRLSLDSENGLSYDEKLLGIQLLLADITDDYRTYMSPVKEFCNSPGGEDAHVLPNGMTYKDVPKGPIGFSANSAFVCAIVARRSTGSLESKKYLNFVKAQIHGILGTGNRKSYMIGFKDKYPQNPHHRDSSCPAPPKKCGWDFYNDANVPNTYEIEGALVGGPNEFGKDDDNRQNMDQNQPNILYNSAFQSAVAGLVMLSSGEMESSGAGSGDFEETESFRPSQNLRHVFQKDGNENLFDSCFSSPCQNNAICTNTENMKYSCECVGNYHGEHCELTLSPEFQWISTWPNGGQVHVHLPSSMFEGKKQLTLAFPPACAIISIEVWHACLVPALTDISNGMAVIQQIGWQSEQKIIGMKYEFAGQDRSNTCFKSSEFGFNISDQEIENPICTKSIPEIEESTEESTTTLRPRYEAIKPIKDNRGIDNPDSTIDESEILPTQLTEKRVPDNGVGVIGDLGLLQADTGMITWISRWSTGGHGTINLKQIKSSESGPWILRFLFPAQCPPLKVEFWHACVVPELSNPRMGLFAFKQVGWHIYQESIGMNVEFKNAPTSFNCMDTSHYHLIFEESSAGSRLDPSACKVRFNETDMTSDRDAEPLPFVVVGGNGKLHKEEEEERNTETKTKDLVEENEPVDLRNLRLRGIKPSPHQNRVSVTRLRARRVSSSTVQISWRRPQNKAKKVQVKFNGRDDSEEKGVEETEEEREDEKNNEKPKIAKLKHVSSAKHPVMPIRTRELSRKKNRLYVKNLLPGKTYDITVRTWDGMSYGPESTVTVTLEPVNIVNIRTTNPSETSLEFHWEKPRGYRKVYRISYFPETPNANPKTPFEISGEKTNVTVVDLAKATDYVFVFSVKKENVARDGKNVFVKTGHNLCGAKKCPARSECSQTERGPDCACDIGFVGRNVLSLSLRQNKIICEDVNECSRRNVCDKNARCINSVGSYECKCNMGYEGDGFSCVDANECALRGLDVCPGAQCSNTFGSYDCECEEGYIYKRSSCVDLDECVTGKFRCPEEADCVNQIGSYTCSCPNGTRYFENECQDIDECKERRHDCLKSEVCLNTKGTFSCVCGKGTRKTKRGCKDINECRGKSHKCSEYAACTNIRTGYRCTCKRGYVGNGFLCKDINECLQENNCDKMGGICTNVPGHYTCSCKDGFTGDGKKCFSFF